MNVGIDIVQISQVERIKNLERFLEKYFNHEEISYICKKSKKEQTIAGIFAGKEAFLKALEIGIGVIPLKEVVIAHKENNSPYLMLNKTTTAILKQYGYSSADISISHGGNYSIAICNLNK